MIHERNCSDREVLATRREEKMLLISQETKSNATSDASQGTSDASDVANVSLLITVQASAM